MKRLRIDMAELGFAFEQGNSEMSYYLDTETGDVLMVAEESRRMLDRIYETQGVDDKNLLDLDSVLAQRPLDDWVKDDVKTAHRIETGFGSRYLQVPETDSFGGYADMKAFIETVGDSRLKDKLWSAIQGKGAFRHFKDTLAAQPDQEKRWFAFKDEQVRLRIVEWLQSIGIEADVET